MTDPKGLARGLTNYGDPDFALYLRRSFARSTGISPNLLSKPVVGIAMTPSGFNNCHRGVPDLVEAVFIDRPAADDESEGDDLRLRGFPRTGHPPPHHL